MKAWEDMNVQEKLAEIARRDLRRKQGKPLQPTTIEIEKRSAEDDARLEKSIQWDVIVLLRAYNFTVWNLSQSRATRQGEGLADLYAVHVDRRQILWFETKTPTGASSPAQLEFQVFHAQLGIEGVRYVVGGVLAAEEYLISIGAAERTATGAIEPTRRAPTP